MNISQMYILTVFEKDKTLNNNLELHRDFIKFLNIWHLNFEECIVSSKDRHYIAVIVDEYAYRAALRYIKDLSEATAGRDY